MPSEPLPISTTTDAEPVRPARRARLPLGVLGMVALICCVESYIMRHDYDLTTLVASNWQVEGRAPARYAAGKQVLCFGDSMVKFGVQPRVLSATLGKSAYNFALYCGPPQTSYFLLKRALDAGARPEALIVDFQPEFLMVDNMNVLSRTFPELLTLRETADLCWHARDASKFGEMVVSMALPSVRKRFEIRAEVLAAIEGKSASVKPALLAAKRNWKLNHGAEALPKYPYFQGEVPPIGLYDGMFMMPWTPRDLNKHYLEKFLKLAASRKVPVFWVIQPNAVAVDQRRERIGYNALYEKFVRGYAAKYTNLTVIDGRHVAFPNSFFTDPVHLDHEGGTAYTQGIADVIRARLDPAAPKDQARWVALPDHRDRPEVVVLEDNIESHAALKAEEAKVRR